MKKIRLAGAAAALLVPVFLLSGCGGVAELTFSANWYRNTALGEDISGTSETLKYKVSFLPPETDSGFSVSYEEGVYTTSLRSELRELPDKSTETVYVYSTELTISGAYTCGGETGEPFTDSITSTVVFRNTARRLAPVSSEKEIRVTAPAAMNPSTLEEASRAYHYSYRTAYDIGMTQATVTMTDLSAETEASEQTISLGGAGTYLDNEEILFALRGTGFSSSVAFRSINPVRCIVQDVATSIPAEEDYRLENVLIGGTADNSTLKAWRVNLGYQGDNPGGVQRLWYAQTVNSSANAYRNVLLRMEVPVMYGLGTLCYTLTEAEFAAK